MSHPSAPRAPAAPDLPAPNQAPHVYTGGEELAHALTHGFGLVASVVGLVLLVVFACLHGTAAHLVGFTVFGVTLVLLYAASTAYHTVRGEARKRLFQKLDHAAIFLLIAGTYTPLMLSGVGGARGWALLAVVWALALAGVVSQLFLAGRFRVATTVAYVVLGWLIVVALKPLIASVPSSTLWLLLAGGFSYTGGVVFYLWKRLRYHHAVWHAFVLGGSTCHYLAVLMLVLPGSSGLR